MARRDLSTVIDWDELDRRVVAGEPFLRVAADMGDPKPGSLYNYWRRHIRPEGVGRNVRVVLTPEQILRGTEMLRRGWQTTEAAVFLGVKEDTLRASLARGGVHSQHRGGNRTKGATPQDRARRAQRRTRDEARERGEPKPERRHARSMVKMQEACFNWRNNDLGRNILDRVMVDIARSATPGPRPS